MPLFFFLFFTGIFATMTGVAIFVALRTRRRARLMAATPTSNIGFATDGYVEFEGQTQAVNGLTLQAPLTGAACVWYHARLEQWRRGSDNKSASWRQVWDATSEEPFLMRDGTGTCIVFPFGAEVTFTDQSVWFGATKIPADKNPARTGPGQSAEGMATLGGLSGQEFRYTEQRVYAGDPLFALGDFATTPWDTSEESDEDEDMADAEAEAALDSADGTDDEADDDEWDDDFPADSSRFDEICRHAMSLTSRQVRRSATQPYLLSTTPQGKLQQVHDSGWKGALFVSLVPTTIVGLLIWLRFGA